MRADLCNSIAGILGEGIDAVQFTPQDCASLFEHDFPQSATPPWPEQHPLRLEQLVQLFETVPSQQRIPLGGGGGGGGGGCVVVTAMDAARVTKLPQFPPLATSVIVSLPRRNAS